MNSFDKVIGYKSIKRELLQICDMIRNRTIYEKMGARLPHGLLLYGDPGLGKSLLANCFMEECGLNTVTVRRDKGGDAFINSIAQAFAKAKEEAPSVLLLDDMDKFANEDSSRCDAPEYVAVQAGIDDVKETAVLPVRFWDDCSVSAPTDTMGAVISFSLVIQIPPSFRREYRLSFQLGQATHH